MKKIVSVLCCAALLCATFAGCYREDYTFRAIDPGELPAPAVERDDPTFREHYPTLEKYDEPVTISVAAVQYGLESDVKAGTTPINQTFNKIAKEYLNIDLEYKVIAYESQYDSKINLAIGAGDYPDMFYTTTPATFTKLRDTGLLADISDDFYMLNDELLDCYLEYMPELLSTVMQEGALYALPNLTNKYTSAQRLYLRKDWLDIVGKEAPTTMEEMFEVGKAFYDHRAEIAAASGIAQNRIIPFTMSKEVTWAGSFSAEGFFNAYGASVGSWFPTADGKLSASVTSQNAKDALAMLNRMSAAHILDPDWTSKTVDQVQTNVKAGYVGMVFGEWWLPKDALDVCYQNIAPAEWIWVDLPRGYAETEAQPVVPRVAVTGYNVVTKQCKHPEAIYKLINLFYDVYYSDDAAERYHGPNGEAWTRPENGFYYQFVPIKLWDGVASLREYERVNGVFDALYDAGFYSTERLTDGLDETVSAGEVLPTDIVISVTSDGTRIFNREIMEKINGNETWKTQFDTLRTREKTLHFVDGYPYYVAMRQGVSKQDMTKKEKAGWGIYSEMVDDKGSYAYVVELTEGDKTAKYNEFYGAALSSMEDYSDYLNTETNKVFTQIITGTQPLSYFDTFVSNYDKNGGKTITDQVNQWFAAQPALE